MISVGYPVEVVRYIVPAAGVYWNLKQNSNSETFSLTFKNVIFEHWKNVYLYTNIAIVKTEY